MTPANARKASFTSGALGNTAAMSGSRTTTALPAGNREAYLFGRDSEKSYSGQTSSALPERVRAGLILAFFITVLLESVNDISQTQDNGDEAHRKVD